MPQNGLLGQFLVNIGCAKFRWGCPPRPLKGGLPGFSAVVPCQKKTVSIDDFLFASKTTAQARMRGGLYCVGGPSFGQQIIPVNADRVGSGLVKVTNSG